MRCALRHEEHKKVHRKIVLHTHLPSAAALAVVFLRGWLTCFLLFGHTLGPLNVTCSFLHKQGVKILPLTQGSAFLSSLSQFYDLQRIHKHENAHIAYQKQLRSEGVVKKEQIDEIHDNISKILSAEFEQARPYSCFTEGGAIITKQFFISTLELT